MSSPPTSEVTAAFAFDCECDEDFRAACKGEPFFKSHEGKKYCVLHYPGPEKSQGFKKALKRKLDAKDFNFLGVWFPEELDLRKFHFDREANFRFATFSALADFRETTFSTEAGFRKAIFKAEAWFWWATFNARASFRAAIFEAETNFEFATFNSEAAFHSAAFSADVTFSGATFVGEANFDPTTFSKKVNFSDATFKDYVIFKGEQQAFGTQSSLNFYYARIEKPDYVRFHTLTLRHHWFVNVDARKFDFTNVKWQGHLDQEIKDLKNNEEVSQPHRLLSIVYRQLGVNAEENHRYGEASSFRYGSMDARWLEHWRGFTPWRLIWWYWAVSGYGERAGKACLWLIGIWLFFAALYVVMGYKWEPKLLISKIDGTEQIDRVSKLKIVGRGLKYSLEVIALQKPEPRPDLPLVQLFVTLETIAGPLQAALLALAIRRKFMR